MFLLAKFFYPAIHRSESPGKLILTMGIWPFHKSLYPPNFAQIKMLRFVFCRVFMLFKSVGPFILIYTFSKTRTLLKILYLKEDSQFPSSPRCYPNDAQYFQPTPHFRTFLPTFKHHPTIFQHFLTYHKILNISPGLIEVRKHFLGGLYS